MSWCGTPHALRPGLLRPRGRGWSVGSFTARRTRCILNPQTALMGEEGLAGVPTLVYANKQDLLGAKTARMPVEELGRRTHHRHAPPHPPPPTTAALPAPLGLARSLPLSHSVPLGLLQAAELMVEMDLVQFKDRWVHVEVRRNIIAHGIAPCIASCVALCITACMCSARLGVATPNSRMCPCLPSPPGCGLTPHPSPLTPHRSPLTAQFLQSAQACSAKTGDGLEQGMQKLMEQKASKAA